MKVAAVLALFCTAHALAGQHLVAPGDSWDLVAQRIKPGDEIILMPGKHVGASLDNVRGTRDKPITIRGVSIEQPAIIDSPRVGIRLRGAQHVVIRDLAITGATVSGITIAHEVFGHEARRQPDRTASEAEPANETPWPAHVTIRNVTIERTGPHGLRNAIHIEGVAHVEIDRVRIHGWGGSAVFIAASSEVRVTNSIMRGRDDHGQLNGIHVRENSERVRIGECYFADAGEAALILGSPANAAANGKAPPPPRRVIFERNVVRRGESGVGFLRAERSMVRNNVFLNPARFAYFIAPPDQLHQVTFGANIVTWDETAPEALSFLLPPAEGAGLAIEQNLWWAHDPPTPLTSLDQPIGNLRAEQVMDVDPNLDKQFQPQAPRAQIFGTNAP